MTLTSAQVFHLDDDLVEMIEAGQVFDLDIAENQELEGKIDITLREVDMKA